jgi:DNA topoisomerase-1
MIVRFGKLGKFLGCSNYPTCKYTTPFEIDEDGRIKIKPQETVEEVCEICGAQMLVKESKKGKFLACSAYPECKNTKPFGKEVDKINKPEPTSEKCPKCDNLLVIKDGKYGKFLSCSNYPKCKYTKSVGIGVMCPECGGNIVRKVSRKGCFYGCENYPECKFATWDEPTNSKCPACNKMLVKKIRKGNEYMFCINEDCSYNEGR